MRRIDKFMLGIYAMMYIFIGVVLASMQGDFFSTLGLYKPFSFVGPIFSDTVFWTISGCIVFVSGISILNIVFVDAGRKKSVIFKTEKGDVKITLSAIEDFVRKTIIKRPEVKDIKCRVFIKPRGIKVNANVVLTSDVGVTNLIKKVQQDIELSIRNMLDGEFNINVDVNVLKMTASKNVVIAIEQEKENNGNVVVGDSAQGFNGIEY